VQVLSVRLVPLAKDFPVEMVPQMPLGSPLVVVAVLAVLVEHPPSLILGVLVVLA
jgi:hypothetical protein